MAIKNYTTSITVEQTISEIQSMLVKAGAKRVMSEYDDEGNICALSFQLKLEEQYMSFTLPTDYRPVFKLLQEQGVPAKHRTEEQARRTAWRITKDWIDAQLAIVETKMVNLPQVFLPYAQMKNGKSVYENFALDSNMLLLGED